MKSILTLSLLVAINCNLFAQNTLGKSDDAARITLASFVPNQIEQMPEAARSSLANKLNQIVTQNGLGGKSSNERFIITANINIISKELTATAPPLQAYVLDVTLYIGDGISGTKFASVSTEVKGIGESETKAYISALKNLKTTDPKYQSFIEKGKTKIIEYYNSKCDFILKEAEMLTSKNEFDAAIATLTSIPEVCKVCYDKAMTAVAPIYQKQIDRQCKANLMEAKNAWNQSQDASGASTAANYLGQIDPNASCFAEAQNFSNAIAKRIKEIDQREWNFKMKQQQDNVDIEKASIKAIRDIGVAYGNGPKANVLQYNVYGWW